MSENFIALDKETRPFGLQDLAVYQEHSVVSREIVRKPSGTMTVFAFDKGEGLSEHTAPFDAFIQILDGTATVTIDKKTYTLNTNDAITMPAGVPHSLYAGEKFKMLLTMIRSN